MYRLPVREAWFDYALRHSRASVCCNGDLFSAAAVRDFVQKRPECAAVMAGRGLAAGPDITNRLKGAGWRSEAARRAALREFHGEIYETCAADFGSARSAMLRMKELWSYLRCLFPDSDKALKRLAKSKRPEEYEAAAHDILTNERLSPDGAYTAQY